MRDGRRLPRLLFLGVFCAGLGCRLLLALAHTTMEADEYSYVRMAQTLVGALPGSYLLEQPVLFPLLVVISHWMNPDWEWAARMVSLLSAAGLLVVLPMVAVDLFGTAWPGIGAAALVGAYPLLMDLGARPMTEPTYDLLLVLAVWQGWRAMNVADNPEAGLRAVLIQSSGLGVLMGLMATARREGLMDVLLLSARLLLATRGRGVKAAFLAGASSLGPALCILWASDRLVQHVRHAPHSYLSPAVLVHLFMELLVPLCLPAVFLLGTARPTDRRLVAFLLSLLLPGLVIIAFPDPGRKATALLPFIALMAAEGCRRLARGNWRQALMLQGCCLLWLLRQGVSEPMRAHFVPPWTDRAEDRAAAEWLRSHGTGPVAAYDVCIAYYASRPIVRVDGGGSVSDFVARCREMGTEYVVVDGRSECRRSAVLSTLADDPGDRPGLQLVTVVPLHLTALNHWLSAPFHRKGIPDHEQAAVYRVLR